MKIVAVGGSGQHAALAIARLRWIGAFPQASAVVIDADRTSAMSTSLMKMGPADLSASQHPLTGADQILAPVDLGSSGKTEFGAYLLDGAHEPGQKDVFELLFSAKQASVPIANGMYGNPAVGGTVFAASKGLKIDAAAGEPVVVIGSFVGGTGSGIMHELLEAAPAAAHRFGVFYLPWFRPKEGGGGGHDVSKDTHHRNMLHGVDHLLAHTRKALKGAVLLGLPETASAGVFKQPVPGDSVTQELPHLIHVAAAYASMKLPEKAVIHAAGAAGGTIYGLGYDPGQERGFLLNEPWHDGRSLLSRMERSREILARLNHILSEKFTGECQKWAQMKVFGGGGQTIPEAFKKTILAHIQGKPGKEEQRREDLRSQVWSNFETIRTLHQYTLEYLEHEQVFGPQPATPVIAQIKEYGPGMMDLGNRWKKAVDPGVNEAGASWNIASTFVEQLVPI